METYEMTSEQMKSYAEHLRMEECSESTVRKYDNALASLYGWLPEDKSVTKGRLLAWKAEISEKNAASTVNVMISAVNSFFAFMSWENLRVKQVKTQRRIYRDKDRELTKEEYMRLLNAARNKGNLRLYYLMQTLGSTGIRISDVNYFLRTFFREGIPCVFRRNPRLFQASDALFGNLSVLYRQEDSLIPADTADKAVVDVHAHERFAVDDFPLVNRNLLDQRVQEFLAQLRDVRVA